VWRGSTRMVTSDRVPWRERLLPSRSTYRMESLSMLSMTFLRELVVGGWLGVQMGKPLCCGKRLPFYIWDARKHIYTR